MMNRKKISAPMAMLFTTLILCSSMGTAVAQATKPLYKLVDIEDIELDDVKGIMKVTVIVFNQEDTVYDVSLTAVISGRMYIDGTLAGTIKVSMHYKGTITSPLGGDPITGKLTYDLSSTGRAEDVFGDGHWVIWYEDGGIEREIGRGELWFP